MTPSRPAGRWEARRTNSRSTSRPRLVIAVDLRSRAAVSYETAWSVGRWLAAKAGVDHRDLVLRQWVKDEAGRIARYEVGGRYLGLVRITLLEVRGQEARWLVIATLRDGRAFDVEVPRDREVQR
jgi:hypothetical protein